MEKGKVSLRSLGFMFLFSMFTIQLCYAQGAGYRISPEELNRARELPFISWDIKKDGEMKSLENLVSLGEKEEKIVKIIVRKVDEEEGQNYPLIQRREEKDLGGAITIIDQLLVLGEKIWNLVLKGKPVIRIEHTPMSVLPHFLESTPNPLELENWQIPKTVKYNYVALTNFGNEAVNFTYAVQFSYGGSYGGKGKYLTGVNIVPLNVKLRWNFQFDAKTYVDSVTNLRTKDDPVAAVTMRINYNFTSMTTASLANESYHITGEGEVLPLQ